MADGGAAFFFSLPFDIAGMLFLHRNGSVCVAYVYPSLADVQECVGGMSKGWEMGLVEFIATSHRVMGCTHYSKHFT